LIFTNKDMGGQQKAIAGGIGVVALLIAGIAGTTLNSPSVEKYTQETNAVVQLTGHDLVFWTKDGEVYHLCAEVSDLQLVSKDNKIYSGTVGDAYAAGKKRLTLEVTQELNQCSLPVPSPLPAGLPSGAR
jgi:hypothetical protein